MNGFDLIRFVLFLFVASYILNSLSLGTFFLVVGAWITSDMLYEMENKEKIKNLKEKYDKATKRDIQSKEGNQETQKG